MGQMPDPAMNQTPEPVMDQTPPPSHTNGIWYVVGAVVVIALGLWYFYAGQAPATNTQSTAVEQAQIPALTGGNTTADISTDLSQVPDTSAALDADASASASAISGL